MHPPVTLVFMLLHFCPKENTPKWWKNIKHFSALYHSHTMKYCNFLRANKEKSKKIEKSFMLKISTCTGSYLDRIVESFKHTHTFGTKLQIYRSFHRQWDALVLDCVLTCYDHDARKNFLVGEKTTSKQLFKAIPGNAVTQTTCYSIFQQLNKAVPKVQSNPVRRDKYW